MRKNNITLSFKNIISFSRNITSYFTGKAKIITLVSIIIMLSFVNITLCSSGFFYNTNVSALSYQSNVGIGFTFNPSISVSISPSNLVIDNLTPSITADSNAITVSVATNAAYGYTLSATVNSVNNSNNSNLTHTNGTSVFSSIATDASLSSLTNDNTWGYSYRLSNNSNSNAWSNYSGLSNETSKTLVESNDQTAIPIDFKIAAKANETQPSGAYTGTINFTAVSNAAPMSLFDSFLASGAEMYNGYFKMQDMTHGICSNVDIEESELQLIDVRDNKVYWVAKLKDGNCWMTQNLDLDLDSNRTYTHYDTDLGWNNSDSLDTNAIWSPTNSTTSVDNWSNNDIEPYSADPGDVYYYTSGSTINDIKYTSLQNCKDAEHDDCIHYHAGNYYNWSASVANNNTGELISGNAPNSICPSGWKLPNVTDRDFRNLLEKYEIQTGDNAVNIRKKPLYFTRSGQVRNNQRAAGYYWSDTIYRNNLSYDLFFDNTYIYPDNGGSKSLGISLRCLSR